MRKMFAIALFVSFSACAHPTVSMHMTESDKNHYVLIEDGAADHYWDCHGLEGGQWAPTCREVRMQYYKEGNWAERVRPAYYRE